MNLLSQLVIYQKFEKDTSVSIYNCKQMALYELSHSLLHIRTMNGVILSYLLALQHLFHFILYVLILSFSFFFSCFFVESTTS